MNLKINLKVGVTALVASMFLYSCSQDEKVTEDEAIFTDLDSQFDSKVIEGQYIIVYRENVVENSDLSSEGNYRMAQQATQLRTQELLIESSMGNAEIVHTYSKALSGATVKLSSDQAARLRGNKDIAYIEQDRIVSFAPPTCGVGNRPPCDEDGGDGGDGGDTGSEETPYGIARVNGGSTSSGVAWILDSGIDLDHPDLNVDNSRGFTAFTSGRDSKSFDDGNGHGTHVAGTIAAIDNDFGVIGVAAGATVIPVKVLDSRGSGSYSGVIAGVDYVAAKGAPGDVANMSLGGPVSSALDNAVLNAAKKGIVFFLAAGNEGKDADTSSPARTNGPNVYTISAMDSNDNWAYFSNYGPSVDYAAPGVAIKSTWKDGGYNTISGTSMASPHAAGVYLLKNISTDGVVNGDPDENDDPIIVNGK